MINSICTTCGTQFPASQEPPSHCPICEDERQYIGWDGQAWTTLDALRADHHNVFKTIEPGLTDIGTEPKFAIGQHAFFIQAPGGNVLWDCISLIDDPTVAVVKSLGGLAAIAISHPHFYSSMIEWSHALGGVPIYLHESNRKYVMRPDPTIVFWTGEAQSLGQGLTLIRCGGHFMGSTVLHWAAGAEGRGVLLTADTINVVADRRYVSFMHSFPNLMPLPAVKVRGVAQAVEPFRFDRIYGGWPGSVVASDAQAAVTRSAERYIRAIEGSA